MMVEVEELHLESVCKLLLLIGFVKMSGTVKH